MKKLVTILVVSIFLGTIIGIYVPIERVKAADPEIPLDQNFIVAVAHALSDIADENDHWMGRAYGSFGEQEAKIMLNTSWDANMHGYDLIPEPIRFQDRLFGGFVDNKLAIAYPEDYELWVNGSKIDQQDYQPIPCGKPGYLDISGEYTIKIPPLTWYDHKKNENQNVQEDISQNVLDEELKKEHMLYEFECTPLNNISDISGDVVYIEDYENASIEDTEGRIHLIEIEQNACDEIFNETVNKVCEYNGAGYIIMTTNPTFINTINTTIPGLAISQSDGEKLKEIIKNNNEPHFWVDQSNMKVYCHPADPVSSSKTIYLINATTAVNNSWDLRYDIAKLTNRMIMLSYNRSDNYPNADAFFWSDLNSDTHIMAGGAGLLFPDFRGPVFSRLNCLIPITQRPIVSISGNLAGLLHKGDKVNIKIHSEVVPDAESYNLIGTIPGDPNKQDHEKQIFIGGHYDSWWGQCPMDNAFGPAIAWGIAKYFHDNNIIPWYTLKLVAWGGEEAGCRGSYFYVNQHLDEKDNFLGIINIDTIGMNTHDIPLTPYVITEDETERSNIIEVMDLCKYYQVTQNDFKLPNAINGRIEFNKTNIGSDAIAFGPLSGGKELLVKYMIHIERWAYPHDFSDFQTRLAFWDHRTGENFQKGDTWSKVDLTDVSCIANMVLNLTKHFAVDSETTFSDDCSYDQQDMDGDEKNDSVKITFSATTDISSWCNVESRIYKNGQPCSAIFKTGRIGILKGGNTTSNLTVTLPANATAGYYNISVYLKDNMGNQNDFENTTIYFNPYNHSVANFKWERNENNQKMINFTDQSLPSPNATLVSWNWSFGDTHYSDEQNCSYNYSSVGIFNVTLTVTDSANKTANVTKQVQTFNTRPKPSFIESTRLVVANTSIDFESESSDVDGTIVNTTWYLGDNTTVYNESINKSYNKSGFYTISFGVTDNDNTTAYIMKSERILVVDALVDDDFNDDPDAHKWNTIEEAIDDAGNDSIIYVFNGSYDPIEITKSVILYGESREDVLISGGNPGVKIRNATVSLNGFNVSEGTMGFDVNVISDENHTSNIEIKNCNIYGNSNIGILLNHSLNCAIENCTIRGNNVGVKIINGSMDNIIKKCEISDGTYGVYVSDSSYNWIGSPSITSPYTADCVFTHNNYSIFLDDSDFNFIIGCDIDGTPTPNGFSLTKGISFDDSDHNIISTCTIHDATEKGVDLNGSTQNKIEHCKITGNPNGVYLSSSFDNLIVQNHFGIDSQYGVYIPSNSKNNSIYYNDFFRNGNGLTNQSFDGNNQLGEENLWCKEGNSTLTKNGSGEGNYWDDYTGEDQDSDGIGDTPYKLVYQGTERNDSYPVMEAYGWCNLNPEDTLPIISNVSNSPTTVGFGYNVTICATVADNSSNISLVKVSITYPDNSTSNLTMDDIGNDTYQYIFTDTWQTGQFNYFIWAMDEAYNSNSSTGHHFHVSANATISICTVKNIFNKSESINFTDPPAHPVNTLDAWQLINRGETWNQYYNQQEKTYRITCCDTPINYKDTGNNYQPINTTIQPLIKTINNTLYTHGVTRGIYSLYLKQTMNATDTTPAVIIEKNRYRMTQTPPDTLMVSYNQKQKISTICMQNTSRITQDGDTALYEHAYRRYNTTDDYAQVSYEYLPTMMKSNLILTDQTAVQDRYTLLQRVLRTDNLWVHYQTQMTALDKIGYSSLGVMQNDVIYRLYGENTAVDLWTADRIWFTDQNNTPVFGIPPLYAVDDAGNATLLMKHLHCGPNTDMMTLTIYVSLPWLADDNRMYPVYIDPSVEINAGSGDGWALQYGSTNWDTVHDGSGNSYSSSSLYDYGIGADCGMTGKYSIYRSFFRFDTSSIPDDASIVNASVFLYGKFYASQPEPVPTPQASGIVFQKWTGGGTISSDDYNDFSGGIYGSLSSWTTPSYNELVWENALSDIDVDGYTDICVREWAHDYNDSAPEEESSYSNYLTYADAPYNKPYINVTYELPPTSPEVTLIIPEDYAMNISLNPCVKVSVTQQEGKNVTVQWYQNATTGSWTLFASNVTDGNETVMQNCPWINENGKWYHLKIDAKVGSWPSVQEYYQFYPGVQSKIENTGDMDINGFLVVWLEEYNVTSGNWSYLDELYRDDMMRRVNSSCSFGIDTVCNGLVNGSMLAGETGGVFRVYAGFYSMLNEVLVCSDDTELVAWWEFEIE